MLSAEGDGHYKLPTASFVQHVLHGRPDDLCKTKLPRCNPSTKSLRCHSSPKENDMRNSGWQMMMLTEQSVTDAVHYPTSTPHFLMMSFIWGKYIISDFELEKNGNLLFWKLSSLSNSARALIDQSGSCCHGLVKTCKRMSYIKNAFN